MKNELQNSMEYLNKKTGRKPGFSVPENYFEIVEESIKNKQKEKNFVKTNGFEVPDSYFKNLEETIIASVSPLKKDIKVIPLKQKVLKFIPVIAAASIVLFLGLNSFFFKKTEENPFDKLTDIEVENWIVNNINLIDDNDFETTYADIEFEEDLAIPSSVSNDELENYLINREEISLILENY